MCIATHPVTARLACVRRAASVQSEPGSNSPLLSLKLFLIYLSINERQKLSLLPLFSFASFSGKRAHTSFFLLVKEHFPLETANSTPSLSPVNSIFYLFLKKTPA